MGLLQSFVPFMRVPSAVLNRIQSSLFDRRGNGVGNTLAVGLDAISSAWDKGTIHISLDKPVPPLPLQLDNTYDYRDRHLLISYKFDPTRDIRPGQPEDHMHARDVGVVTAYTRSGSATIRLGPDVSLFVGPTGVLFVNKNLGYAYISVELSTQIKERS